MIKQAESIRKIKTMNTFWKLLMNISLCEQKATNPQLKRLSWLNKKEKNCGLDKAESAIILSLSNSDKLKNW